MHNRLEGLPGTHSFYSQRAGQRSINGVGLEGHWSSLAFVGKTGKALCKVQLLTKASLKPF